MNYLSPQLQETCLSSFFLSHCSQWCPAPCDIELGSNVGLVVHDVPVCPSSPNLRPMIMLHPLCPHLSLLPFFDSFLWPGLCPGHLPGQSLPCASIWPYPGRPSRKQDHKLCLFQKTISSAPRSPQHSLLAQSLCLVSQKGPEVHPTLPPVGGRILKWPGHIG